MQNKSRKKILQEEKTYKVRDSTSMPIKITKSPTFGTSVITIEIFLSK